MGKTHVIALDLRSYFDTVRHHIVLEKVARRVSDSDVLHLLKWILGASGKVGVPQGGVISPLLSNTNHNEIERMLERANTGTQDGKWILVEYARLADDLWPWWTHIPVMSGCAGPSHEDCARSLLNCKSK